MIIPIKGLLLVIGQRVGRLKVGRLKVGRLKVGRLKVGSYNL
jgi:hypothetical protein